VIRPGLALTGAQLARIGDRQAAVDAEHEPAAGVLSELTTTSPRHGAPFED
jgi:hypothetical protein